MSFIQIFTSLVNLMMLFMIFDFLRREKLKEKYSILWLMTILFLQGFIFFDKWFLKFSKVVGVFYPPSLMFYLAILFLFIIVLHLSLVVSKLSRQNQILAQKLALLELHSQSHPQGE
jgi:hypothetical protein